MIAESWQPLSVDALRVGQFIRLGHRWFEHPFLMNRFRISSENEIAIIRNAQLTKLYIDVARSTPVSVPQAAGTEPPRTPDDVESVATQMQSRKTEHAERVRHRHQELTRTRELYQGTAEQCAAAFEQLARGDAGAFAALSALSETVVSVATRAQSPLTFAAIAAPGEGLRRRSCQALDAAAIAAAVGRRLALPPPDMTTLTLAALVHAAGIEQLPAALQDESAVAAHEDRLGFQDYPLLGADQLRRCGDFPVEILQIVRQHRERLDGSGFPEGASGEAIHAYARIVGAIHEFQVLSCRAQSALPAAALAHLYRNLRGAYGPAAVDNVIAALTVYPPGSYLTLSDGSVARVMQVSEHARLRPTVCLFDDTVTPTEAQIVDLNDTQEIAVAGVLDPGKLTSDMRAFFGSGWPGLAFSGHAPEPARP